MATYKELGYMTHGQMGTFTHQEIKRLTIDQIEQYVNEIWPLLSSLDATDREELRLGINDGSLPPPLLASGGDDGPKYTDVQAAALEIWTRVVPQNAAEFTSYLALILALLTFMKDEPPATPPPITVIVNQLLPEVQPQDITEDHIEKGGRVQIDGTQTSPAESSGTQSDH